jgi:hypothetical protein
MDRRKCLIAPDGKVTGGPARRDLLVLNLSTDQKGDLLVTLPAA